MSLQILAQIALGILMIFRGSKPTQKLAAVSEFQIERFAGTWYLAAHVPLPFKTKLSCITTEYSLGDDGTIRVIDRGYNKKKNTWDHKESVATFYESSSAGWLQLDTGHPFSINRKIVYLSEDYGMAIIVGLTMRTMWIVYRNPDVSKRDIDRLIVRAEEMGFKTKKIKMVDQSQSWEPTQT